MKFGLTRWTPARTARWEPFDEMRQMQQQLNSMFKDMTLGDRWTEADTLGSPCRCSRTREISS